MIIYNTLTRSKEEFVPLKKGVASIYSCGPTVYGYAHIGNMRTYVFMDFLRRVMKYNGLKLKHVMNVTDVGHLVSDADEGEDKVVRTAKETGKTPYEIAEYFSEVFFRDIALLNIEKPEIIAKATDNISEMIEYVEALVDKGFAYETSDGIYFDIMKFPGYGRLSRIDLEEQLAGSRVEVNEEKHHPADFALWKKASKEHIMQWPSPWGMGYPGWHIECSAMGRKYLGDIFDIHTGGVDHIPIHHENEIAQSEALAGKKTVNCWMHGEFLLVDNGKMSKSLGNTYTIADLQEKGFVPLAFRYFCMNAHYRSKLNFTWDSLRAAQTSLERLYEGVLAHKAAAASSSPAGVSVSAEAENCLKEFEEAINDDLNIPKALGIVWNTVKKSLKSKQIYDVLMKMDRVLGLDLDKAEEVMSGKSMGRQAEDQEVEKQVLELVDKRNKARAEKDWKTADEIRDILKAKGITIEDTPDGARIIKT
ncbi:MAG: cysteine--tRNA ligase [Eubacteriales bacterium]|nr:cysteine--tRNA ligase [Eubacteriales bacterium]